MCLPRRPKKQFLCQRPPLKSSGTIPLAEHCTGFMQSNPASINIGIKGKLNRSYALEFSIWYLHGSNRSSFYNREHREKKNSAGERYVLFCVPKSAPQVITTSTSSPTAIANRLKLSSAISVCRAKSALIKSGRRHSAMLQYSGLRIPFDALIPSHLHLPMHTGKLSAS